ncbi:MAG: PD40 domain-containing protein [Acidobacteria bacterium]|nr:PD40 domain-containing protein [Acidobacteriota bacterium]
MKRQTFVLVVLAAASSAALCVLCVPEVEAGRAGVRLVTREVPLGRVPAGEPKVRPWVSHDHRHVAFIAKVEGGEAAYVDGRAGKTYPSIASDPLSEAGTGNPFTFSRDGRHAAYVAQLSKDDRPRRVVLDGAEGAVFDYVWSGGLGFSEDGRHFAYTAERGGKRFAVVDGAEYGPYDRVGTPAFREYKDRGFVFAFDATRGGRQLFVVNGQEYAADDVKGRELFFAEQAREPREVVREGKHWVVWEGHEVGPFDDRIGVTGIHTAPRADGGSLVTFEGERGGKQIAVVDGVVGKPYDYVGEIYVSKGAAHTLYPARRGDNESFVVLDGKEGPTYENVDIDFGGKPFSPDGQHYAYAALRKTGDEEEKFLVVADGKEGKPYDYVTGVTYTPDGAHLLYLAYDRARGKSFLVRDGEEVGSYNNVPDTSDIHFSPDGKRMFFRLRKEEGGKDGLVVDGRAYYYDDIKDAEFSEDGRHFVFKAQRGRGWVMVVDGVESELYEPDGEKGEVGWSRDGRLALSREGGRVAYVGRKGGKEFVVLDGAAGASYDSVANLDFTPDGRHAVYTARRAGKSLLVVDGAESREYDAFLPASQYESEGHLNVEGPNTLSILARRGAELLRVEIEIAEG